MLTADGKWAKGPFEDGQDAYYNGERRHSVPSSEVIGEFSHESWLAGWDNANNDVGADADAG